MGMHERIGTGNLESLILLGLIASCWIASGNYVLNEILDAPFDAHHPRKNGRPAVSGRIRLSIAWAECIALIALGMLCAAAINRTTLLATAAFFGMALAYNVPPIRLKDYPYVDALIEGLNSPIRFLLGWTIVSPDASPPLVLLVGLWSAGTSVMTQKRLKEIRLFPDRRTAALYRRSFHSCSEQRLRSLMLLYALIAAGCMLILWAY